MKKNIHNKLNNEEGITLIEMIISIFLLSLIVTTMVYVFVFSARVTRNNRLEMTSINLANKVVEEIRGLPFGDVGTMGGNPMGVMPQDRTEVVDGVEYNVNTAINWEEEGGDCDSSSIDWDYKSVRVTVVPTTMAGKSHFVKKIETYVTRDSAQPALTGGNVKICTVRGWKPDILSPNVPASNVVVRLLRDSAGVISTIQSSSAGASRFLDLNNGNYKVNVNPSSSGLILHPNTDPEFIFTISGLETHSKKFEVEKPCKLHIRIKDIDDHGLHMPEGRTGKIVIGQPYGHEIDKTFTSHDLDSNGNLPNDFITNLWPVGEGYAGFYEVKELSLDDYLILSVYESDGHSEIIWDGTFSGPGTNKNLVAYVTKIPEITGIDSGWISGNSITTGSPYIAGTPDSLEDGAFITDHGVINMPMNTTAKFTASSIYFQPREANLNLNINIAKRSTLNLHSRSVIFNGKVDFQDDGKIVLETSNEDGSYISEIDGGLIGEDPMQNYGIVYIAEPMTLNNASTVVNSGMYYFKNGIILPGEGEQLIPITKENYIHD